MRSIIVAQIASAAITAAAVDSTTVSVFIPEKRPRPCDGSVVNVGSTATTYSFECYLAGRSATDYGVQTWNIAQGPSTWVFSDDTTTGLTKQANCKLDPEKDIASCEDNFFGTIASTEISGYMSSMMPVTITAGAEKLSAAPGPTKTGVTTTATNSNEATATRNTARQMTAPNTVLAGVAAVIAVMIL